MKNLKLTFAAFALLSLLTVPALAQTKVASVDMLKIFNGYWKTKQAQALLEKDQASDRKDLKDMADGIDKAQMDYKQLLEQANDQAISADERARLKQSAADKLKDITDRKSAFESYSRQVQSRLADQTQRVRGNLITEIQKAVTDKANASGYALVVNSANTDAIIFASKSTDLTDDVLKQLNTGMPLDVTVPSTPAAPTLMMSTNGVP